MLKPSSLAPLARGLAFAAIAGVCGVIIGGGPLATTASADPPEASEGPYTLKCWQEGVQIFSAQEKQGLKSLDLKPDRGTVFENKDGSRRILVPLGASLCIAELARR